MGRDEFIKQYPNLKDFLPYLDVLNKESGRGKVLISAGFLEEQLKQILLAFMLDTDEARELLEGGNAPLGSFSARTNACYVLGLITESEHRDLVLMRRIRNDFAHKVQTSFETESVKNRCKELKYRVPDSFPVGDMTINANAEGQFTTAAVSLIMNLTNRAHYVGQERRAAKGWPY